MPSYSLQHDDLFQMEWGHLGTLYPDKLVALHYRDLWLWFRMPTYICSKSGIEAVSIL